ncbi:hypothetical protein IMZ48_16340 [Candidatus Bathyarchaeota archaeon]|nr:hypothetical protein [Candidatus Bathyarchaeota archaeon]
MDTDCRDRHGQRRITHTCAAQLIITIAIITSSVVTFSVPMPPRIHAILLAISHIFTAALVLHRAYTPQKPFHAALLSAAAVFGAIAVFSLHTGLDTRGLSNAVLFAALICGWGFKPLFDAVTGMAEGEGWGVCEHCGVCLFCGGTGVIGGPV